MIKIILLLAFLTPIMLSTLYSVSPDFTVSFQPQFDELAHAYYDLKSKENGWNYLYIQANGQKNLLEQHRGAGFLEGYASYNEIYAAYNNLVKSILKTNTLDSKIQTYIDDQLEYLDRMCELHVYDVYWQYAQAYLEQIRYMHRGYLDRIHRENRADMYLGFSQFYCLTYVGDLEDLIPAFSNHSQKDMEVGKQGNCNGYVKVQNNQLLIGHGTHNNYYFLLRTFKSYNFPTRNPNVGSERITFSSRPGDLISKDDFYVLSSGLKVLQTSFQNRNPDNYKDLSSRTVPNWLRACISVNLAKNADQWTIYFSKERSGTHNNQWMIIDASKLKELVIKEVVVFFEEAFSMSKIIDMTDILLKNGFVGSYNFPYDPNISKKLGYQKYPYDYWSDPRATILKNYHPHMIDQESMKFYLVNNQENDYRVGLAPRYDLVENGYLFGMTDCKIITPKTEKNNFIWAISGPPTSNGRFPPFDWRNWPKDSPEGMPVVFNFSWIQVKIDYTKSIGEDLKQMEETLMKQE